MRKINGSVTIFFSLTISTFILFLSVLIRLVLDRYEKERFEIISDICITSILGEYSIPLYETYDLLYIDSGYSGYAGDVESVDTIKSRAEYYFEQNISQNSEVAATGETRPPWGEICIESVGIDDFQTAAAGFGQSMRAQIGRNAESGKYDSYRADDVPGDIESIVLNNENSFWEEWQGLMQAINEKKLPKKMNSKTGKLEEVPLTNPADWVYSLSRNDILFNTGTDISDISNALLPLEDCISQRGARNTMELGNIPHYDNSAMDCFLLQKMNSFQNRLQVRLSGNELEYILEGEGSDYVNFRKVVEDITDIRISDNRNHIENNSEIIRRASEEARKLEVCTLDESFIEPVAKSIVYACVYLETLNDITRLLKGNRIPLVKNNIYVRVENVISESRVSAEYGGGYTYIQYLIGMINEMDEMTLNLRVMDLIEMEIRRQTGSRFRMDFCIERLYMSIEGSGKYGGKNNINRVYGYY
ncbi:MAG: DUF5702 domain-containing protein [Lachnospiraceae bacterium]|nr:DUF5702 domain-containing protein [Lachnospiraceae bacterium]